MTAWLLDVKKAHKREKMASEQGFSVFTAVDPEGPRIGLFTSHATLEERGVLIGGRVAASFVRLGHVLLHSSHFFCMYVA